MKILQRASLAHLLIVAAVLFCLSTSILRGQAESIPESGTFLFWANTNSAPLPFDPYLNLPVYKLDDGRYLIDDRSLDWEAILAAQANAASSESAADGPVPASYGPDDLWIELISMDTVNQTAFLRLHGTVETNFYQLLLATNVAQKVWFLGEFKAGAPDTNQTDFPAVPIGNNTVMFFRAHQANLVLSVSRSYEDAIEPTNATSGQDATFTISGYSISGPIDSDLTVYYQMSGAAMNGVDYTNLSGVVTIPAYQGSVDIFIHPLLDVFTEFDEPVILTLVQTNDYLIQAEFSTATILVRDNFGTNIFLTVATNLDGPTSIDYHPPTQSLIVGSAHNLVFTNNFVLINSNGVATNWTTVTEAVNEVKLAVVQQTANGFTQGEVYFNGQNPGDLARIAANGATWNTNWASLPNEPFYNEGGFYVDQSGVFSNELIVVTGQQSSDGADIWRVGGPTNATWLAFIPAVHCEGVITLPNDVMRWGPWAGKIITGAEQMADPRLPTLTYAIDTNGVVTTFDLGISAEDFDIIRLNQDLYCLYEAEGKVLKLSHTLLQEYVGDLLVTQGGLYVGVPELFIVHWDGAKFVTRLIPLDYYSQGTYVVPELEQSTFAPIELPVISPVMNMVAPLLPGGLPQLP